MDKKETLKDILVDGVKWRVEEIIKCAEVINFDEMSYNELNELLEHLDESLLGITRLLRFN